MGNFQDILERFIELGGTAENICLRKGELGRGIFPIDSFRTAKIMTPKNLLVDREDVCISRDEIYINDSSGLSPKEKNFIEHTYNYSWSGGGNRCSTEFLKYVLGIPEPVQNQLLGCGFIDSHLLNNCLDENVCLQRFIDERVVDFKARRICSILDFVNHSSFSSALGDSVRRGDTPN